MAAKRKDHRPHFIKNVVQAASRTSEQAAWELLNAINELFPEKINELCALGDRLRAEVNDEAEPNDRGNVAADARFLRGVRDWTAANNIASASVDDAAEKWATGNEPEHRFYLVDEFDQSGNLIKKAPTLTAYPYNETRDEFLEKAGKYYDQMVQVSV